MESFNPEQVPKGEQDGIPNEGISDSPDASNMTRQEIEKLIRFRRPEDMKQKAGSTEVRRAIPWFMRKL